MSTLNQLESHIEQLGCAIRAAEAWADSYKKDPKTWKQLIRNERRMERKLRSYFKDLSKQRVVSLVKWDEFAQRSFKMADYEVTVGIDDTKAAYEQQILLQFVYDDVVATIALGAAAGEAIYDIPVGVSATKEVIEKVAKEYVGQLVKGITQTTLKRIRSSIETSIELGETHEQAVTRLQKYIRDPKRADLIARTEAVRAYGAGNHQFAVSAGATTKTWEVVPGACDICLSVGRLNKDSTVAIADDFQTIAGPVPYQPAHPRCRCGVYYNFE